MTFTRISQYFEQLEKTSSRNAMVEILADLFKESSGEEIDKVIYLTQGRVAPLYEPLEFQMAEQLVLKALSQAYLTSQENVLNVYKKAGDLGVAAQELAKDYGLKEKADGTVKEVFDKLLEIAKTSGEGSIEKKITLLSQLLKGFDPLSVRYLVRILVDKMRLGFSDMTILEGLSWMICGSKELKEKLEQSYNVRPDLGFIARQCKMHGADFIVQPAVGTPILSMRAERLTSAKEILEKGSGKVAVEPKFDGLRTQLHFKRNFSGDKRHPEDYFVRLFSRGLEDVTNMYPDLVKAAKQELAEVDEVILDGEAIGFDLQTGKYLPFQETVTRKRKHKIDLFSQSVPLKLVVFDALFLDGQSLLTATYQQRREIVEKVTKGGKIIVPAERVVVETSQELETIFERNVKAGLEGIMAKRLDGVYQAGARGWNWIKLKNSYTGDLADTIDAVVMGYDFGQGKRNKFGVGAFLIGVYDKKNDSFKTISKVGTGLTDEEWQALAENGRQLAVKEKPPNYEVDKAMTCDVWVKPKLVGVFRADDLTKSPIHTAGYALRFPRLDYWRTDKQPEEATSLEEIWEMANKKTESRK